MKRIVYRYRISKFKRFMNGLVFAIISVIALILCFIGITDQAAARSEIILPFGIAIISMLMGFVTMFKEPQESNQKI